MIFSTQSFAKHILLIVSSFILMSKILINILFQYNKMDRIEVKYQWLFIQLNKLFLSIIPLVDLWPWILLGYEISDFINLNFLKLIWCWTRVGLNKSGVFFKIKVIYMIMYEFLFSLKAFVHCKTISFFDFDGCFFHNFCGMLSPTNHLPKLFVKSFSYKVWSFNLDIANECKLQVFTVWNQNDMHFKTLHPQTIPTHLYGTRVDLAVVSHRSTNRTFLNHLCNFIHIIWLNHMWILYLNIQLIH